MLYLKDDLKKTNVSLTHCYYRKAIQTLISPKIFCCVFTILPLYLDLIIQLSIQSLSFDISDTETLDIEILNVPIPLNTTKIKRHYFSKELSRIGRYMKYLSRVWHIILYCQRLRLEIMEASLSRRSLSIVLSLGGEVATTTPPFWSTFLQLQEITL